MSNGNLCAVALTQSIYPHLFTCLFVLTDDIYKYIFIYVYFSMYSLRHAHESNCACQSPKRPNLLLKSDIVVAHSARYVHAMFVRLMNESKRTREPSTTCDVYSGQPIGGRCWQNLSTHPPASNHHQHSSRF